MNILCCEEFPGRTKNIHVNSRWKIISKFFLKKKQKQKISISISILARAELASFFVRYL